MWTAIFAFKINEFHKLLNGTVYLVHRFHSERKLWITGVPQCEESDVLNSRANSIDAGWNFDIPNVIL